MAITTGDLDAGGRAAAARFPGSFLDDEDNQPFQALNLQKSSAEGSIAGSVKMFVLDEEIENSHTRPFFVMSEGQIIGAVKIGHSFKVSPEDFDMMKSLHGLDDPTDEYDKYAYGYRIQAVESFEDSIKVAKAEGVLIDVEAYLPNNVIKMYTVQKSVEERIVASAVLVPGVTDLHDEIYDEDVVREAAYYFLEHYLLDEDHGIDVMHDGEIVPDAIRPLQSFVLDDERTYTVDVPALIDDDHPSKENDTITFPKGSWLMYARVVSDVLWDKVKDGGYTTWSIAGLARVRELRKILSRVA